ncbi:MAG: DUF2442 domain-containing protein [Candidatus Hydrogenedentes bacterium]|nr:DUF2442 domain-containing protein [Candidatus Hydrogenedentota bacterium]
MGAVFGPLRDLEEFRLFALSEVLHTIRWENNADVAPEYLCAKMLDPAAGQMASCGG